MDVAVVASQPQNKNNNSLKPATFISSALLISGINISDVDLCIINPVLDNIDIETTTALGLAEINNSNLNLISSLYTDLLNLIGLSGCVDSFATGYFIVIGASIAFVIINNIDSFIHLSGPGKKLGEKVLDGLFKTTVMTNAG
jgi:hypothetical protein